MSFTRRRCAGVEAGERLVEHQQLRLVDQGAGEDGFLLHAAREGLAAIIAVVPQAEKFEQAFGIGAGGGGIDAPEAGDEFEIFPRGELVIEQGLVRQPGDGLLGGERIAAGVGSEDA